MRLLNHAKVGLALVTMVVLLGVATEAHADQAATAATDNQTAITGPSDQPTGPGNNSNTAATATGNPDPGTQTQTAPATAPANTTANPDPGTRTQTAPATAPANTTANPDPGTRTQTAPATAPANTTANPDPDQQGTPQTLSGQVSGSGSGDQNTGVAESNTTTETIWQVQISGCTAHCQGITQTQAAEQQNVTVQVVEGVPQVVTAVGTQAGAGEPSQITTSITQIQVGCLLFCFGATTTSAAISQGIQQTLGELLSLALAGTGLPSQQAAPAAEQNIVNQTAYQWQLGQGTTGVQTQSASQTNNTVQVVASLSAALQAAVGSSDPSAAGIMNQTEQGIWQLQIGCLIFCAQTQQYQQAEQANTTTQVLIPAPGSTAATTAAAVNSAAQVIWQMQIGCLLWCVDATEQQTAASNQTTLVAIGDSPTTSAPPPDPSTGSTSNSAVASPSSATTAPAGSNPPSDPTSSADATASGPAPVTPASGAPAPTQTTPSTRTPTTTPSTMVLPSIPFTAVPPEAPTTSGGPPAESSTPSRPAPGAGAGPAVRERLSVPRTLITVAATDPVLVGTAPLGPTAHGVEHSLRQSGSAEIGHRADIARLSLPSPLWVLGGLPRTAGAAESRRVRPPSLSRQRSHSSRCANCTAAHASPAAGPITIDTSESSHLPCRQTRTPGEAVDATSAAARATSREIATPAT